MSKPKILIFDIETIAQPFTTGADHTGRTKIRAEHCAVVCFGYMWLGDKTAKCISSSDFPKEYAKDPFNDKKLLTAAAKILLEADFVIAHYGSGFDLPLMKTRFFLNGLDDAGVHLSKIKMIDTCLIARRVLKVSSSSLRYLSTLLGFAPKGQPGKECWTGVMRSEMKAIKDMTAYCKKDVTILQELYLWLRGKFPNHPNLNFEKKSDKPKCPVCLSEWLVYPVRRWLEGKSEYQRVKCRKCGSETRGSRLPSGKTQ